MPGAPKKSRPTRGRDKYCRIVISWSSGSGSVNPGFIDDAGLSRANSLQSEHARADRGLTISGGIEVDVGAGHFGERREVITGNHVVPIRVQIDSHEVEVMGRGRIETQRNSDIAFDVEVVFDALRVAVADGADDIEVDGDAQFLPARGEGDRARSGRGTVRADVIRAFGCVLDRELDDALGDRRGRAAAVLALSVRPGTL